MSARLTHRLFCTACLGLTPLCCSTTPVIGSFAGEDQRSEFFAAIVTDGDRVVGYVCDGATTAAWFQGSTARDVIELMANNGDSILAVQRQSEDALDATLERNNASDVIFNVARTTNATATTGLCVAQITIDGRSYLGGWIVLNGDRQRGAIRSDDGNVLFVEIDIPTMIATVPGLGVFQATQLTPELLGVFDFNN